MADNQKIEGILPAAAQLGIIVKDIEKAADFYTKLGLGPFHIMDADVEGFTYKGKDAPHKVRLGYNRSNPHIELVQPVSGDTPNSDFLKEKGEGISHLAFNIDFDEFDNVLAALEKEGVKPIFYRYTDDGKYAYVDADQTGGLMFELMAPKKKQ